MKRINIRKDITGLRQHRRFPVNWQANIKTAYGDTLNVRIVDISRSGFGLEGDQQLVATLLPNFYRDHRHIPEPFDIELALPGRSATEERVRIRCSTVYIRRLADQKYRLNTQFMHFHEGNNALADYLTERCTSSTGDIDANN